MLEYAIQKTKLRIMLRIYATAVLFLFFSQCVEMLHYAAKPFINSAKFEQKKFLENKVLLNGVRIERVQTVRARARARFGWGRSLGGA